MSPGADLPTDPTLTAVDGRRQRGEDNRARIVAAMLEVIHGGNLSPSAELIAARAEVSLRTVFRHFADMDSLYREMSLAIERAFGAVVDMPFTAEDWRGRVIELVGRRAAVFEEIAPYKRASDAYRHRSKFLEADNDRFIGLLREILRRELPAALAADELTFEALDLLLGFDAWSRLRREQGLSAERTRAVLEAAVGRLIA